MHIDPTRDSLSHWHATEPTVIPTDPLPRTAETVVIGGGMLGAWTTYWLAKAGHPVTLLEKSAIGWGATGRNGGFLTGGAALGYASLIDTLGHDRARALCALTIEGQELAHAIVQEEAIDCDLRRTGTLSLALSATEHSAMQRQHELLANDGFSGDVLDRAAVQDMIGTPLSPEIVGGFHYAGGGLLHSTRYLAGLVAAARRYGAHVVRAEVSAISGDQHPRLTTDIGTIEAERVIVALNAWTDTLIPEMQNVIVPTRGQILAYEPAPRVFTTATGTDVTPTGEYWQQTMDGSIVIGGCRADAPNRDEHVREMVHTPEITDRIEQVLPRLFPELASLRVARRWAGLMAFTSDYLPVVDASQSASHTWYGGGFNGHGMPFGPIVGKLLAETTITGDLPGSLQALSAARTSLQPRYQGSGA